MMTVTLEMVRSKADVRPEPLGAGAVEYPVGPEVPGSPLSLGLLELEGTRLALRDDDADQVLYVLTGSVRIDVEGESHDLGPASALRLAASEEATLTVAGSASLLRARAGSTADVHAPLGNAQRVAVVDASSLEGATSNRSFQILFGPGNGFPRATLFLGIVPPGAAPWHFHQYEEVMWSHRGRTVFHQEGGSQPMEPGSVVRIRSRARHVNENPGESDAYVIGLVTPASSPSAAYLADAPRG